MRRNGRNGTPAIRSERDVIDAAAATSFLLPANIEAEKAVIGSLLQDIELLPVVQQSMRIGDRAFTVPTLNLIYRGLLVMADRVQTMHDRTPESDAIVLLDALKRIDPEHKVTFSTLAELLCEVPSRDRAGMYASLLQEAAMDRAMIAAAHDSIQQAKHREGTVRERLAFLADQCQQIAAGLQRNESSTLSSVIADIFPGFDTDRAPAAVVSPWRRLDDITGGWHGSELIVPAARPGVGKTSLLVNVADNVLFGGGRVLFFSLEMSKDQLAYRFLSLLSQVPVRAFFKRDLSKPQKSDVHSARQKLDQWGSNLLVDDDSNTTIDDIRARAAVHHSHRPLSCVMVDYLQLVRSTGQYDRRDLEVAAVARGLKALSKDLDVPVFATAQVRREVDDVSKPRLRDLRESGDIESAADQVIFMVNESAGDEPVAGGDQQTNAAAAETKKSAPQRMRLIVAKNRHGPTGDVELVWMPFNMELRSDLNTPAVCCRGNPVDPPSLSDFAK